MCCRHVSPLKKEVVQQQPGEVHENKCWMEVAGNTAACSKHTSATEHASISRRAISMGAEMKTSQLRESEAETGPNAHDLLS